MDEVAATPLSGHAQNQTAITQPHHHDQHHQQQHHHPLQPSPHHHLSQHHCAEIPPATQAGQLMVTDYCGAGLIGPDCSIANSVDPSWLSAECYPSRAYDPLPLPPHDLEDPICVKAERTFTPEPSRPPAYEGHSKTLNIPYSKHSHTIFSARAAALPCWEMKTGLDLDLRLREKFTTGSFQDPVKYRNLRPHSTPATLLWLDENYEMAEGVCIPRNTLYLHYVDFCAKNSMQPVNAASFGKIIRQQFPALTTRRLGTRGQSRYHYYGIAIREHSPYFEPTYSRKSGETPDGQKREPHKEPNTSSAASVSQRVKLTAVLPNFPTLRTLSISQSVDREQVASFLTMYRAHSQRVLDTILSMSLEQVRINLQHFWFGIPQHLASGLGCPVLVNLVALCDSTLYKTVCNLLVPSLTQPLPESFVRMIEYFTQDYESWLDRALGGFPKALQQVKMEFGRYFIGQLRRRVEVNQLSQASKILLANRQLVSQVLDDWRALRMSAGRGLLALQKERAICHQDVVSSVLSELESCLESSNSLETLLLWMDSVVEKFISGGARSSAKRSRTFNVNRPSATSQTIRDISCGFLRAWRECSQRIFREVQGAPHFPSFQLLRILCDDYIQISVSIILEESLIRDLHANIQQNCSLDISLINLIDHGSPLLAETLIPKSHLSHQGGTSLESKPVQLCTTVTQQLQEKNKIRRSDESAEAVPQTTPPVAIFYETNCYTGVTSVIQQTTNIITTTATAASSLYGPPDVLENPELATGQPAQQCVIISGETTSDWGGPSLSSPNQPHVYGHSYRSNHFTQ